MTERLGAISSVRTSHYFFGGKEEGRRYFSRLFDLLRFSEDFGAQQSRSVVTDAERRQLETR